MKWIFQLAVALLPLLSMAHVSVAGVPEPAPGTIKGKVFTSDNRPAASVTVLLKGTNKNALTEEDGTFIIQKVAPGTYQLEVSLIGYETLLQEVAVEDNKVTAVNLQLNLSNTQLIEVIVTNAKNKFGNKTSTQVARLPLKNLENPQVYSVVGRQLMQEQVVLERTDLYRNIPGAVPNFAAGGSQGMSMRGFQNFMGMRNGMMTSAIVPLNPIILERVEAIKGPSGTLFGSNRNLTFGGVFNYVTKKPYENFGGEINIAGGSYEFGRITADINTPLNKDKTMLLRVNAGAQSEGSFQDQGFAKNYTLAPSFFYQVNDRLSFSIEAELTRGNYTTTSFALPGNMANISARSLKDIPLNYKSSYINNSIDIRNGINNIQAQVEYKISSQWKSQTNYLYSEGFYKNLYWTTLTLLTDSTVQRSVRNQTPETFGNIQLQQNFIGDFLIGRLRNRMVVGLDYNYNYNELYRSTFTYDVINLRQSITGMNTDKLFQLSGQTGFTTTATRATTYSAYVSDVLNISPSLMVMLSGRLDRFTTDGTFTPATGKYAGEYNQTSFSPKLGVVYQVLPGKLSVFGNYMNGFVNLAPVTQPDATVLVLDPQFGNQLEGGIKFELMRNKLSGSVSFYDIAVSNSTRTEVRDGKNFTVQDGTQSSKGFEAEVIANPVAGLNIVAGYAFNENKYEKATPALTDKLLTFSPKHVGNIWVSYLFTKGCLKGFGLGAGGNYVSDSWYDNANTFTLPGYTLVNATVFYDLSKFRIAVKANNLLDEQYWNTVGLAQKPLNFTGSVTLRF